LFSSLIFLERGFLVEFILETIEGFTNTLAYLNRIGLMSGSGMIEDPKRFLAVIDRTRIIVNPP
jgi:hypothetical protein